MTKPLDAADLADEPSDQPGPETPTERPARWPSIGNSKDLTL